MLVSSSYLRLLIFLPAILIPACASSSPAFLMMYSAQKLNKQGDNIQPWCTPFPIWDQSVVPCPVLTVASWPAYRFHRNQVRWSGIPISLRISHRRRSQDGGGIGRGDHFLSYKFIKRITELRANFTKQLLITSWGHQAPRKATHCLRKEVGKNIKDKKRDKRAKDGDPSWEGSLNRGSFQTPGNPHTAGLGEVFESRRATWLGGEQ